MNGENKGNIILLSVLGTTSYSDTWYEIDGKKYQDRYIQNVLCKYLKEKHKDKEFKLKIFLTGGDNGARKRNWEKSEGKDDCLQCRLEQNDISYDDITIQNGEDEAEIWQNFNKFYDEIGDYDTVYIDITHSFRSIPVILLSVLELAKKTKNIKIEEIFYGSFEQGKTEDNPNKVISLGIYDKITDWENAINMFLKTGRAEDMVSLAKKFSREKRGQIFNNKEKSKEMKVEESKFFVEIEKLSESIENFSKELLSVRGLTVVSSAIEIKDILDEIDISDVEKGFLSPFLNIIDKIKSLFSGILKTKTKVENINEIISLCIKEFGLIQQGLTFLEENATSYIYENINWNCIKGGEKIKPDIESEANKKDIIKCRDAVSKAFKEGILPVKLSDSKIKSMSELIENIKGIRNDINHAGFRDSPADYDSLKKSLEDNLDKFVKILNENN